MKHTIGATEVITTVSRCDDEAGCFVFDVVGRAGDIVVERRCSIRQESVLVTPLRDRLRALRGAVARDVARIVAQAQASDWQEDDEE